MERKRLISLSSSICLVQVLALAALLFITPLTEASAQTPPPKGRLNHLTLGGGGAGGGLKARCEAIAEAIRRNTNYQVTVLTSDMRVSPLRMDAGEQDLAFLGAEMGLRAIKGTAPYNKPIPIRALAHATLQPQQVVVNADMPYTSLQEIVDKKAPLRMSVGVKLGGTHTNNEAIWKAHGGESVEDLAKWGGKVFYLGSGDTFEQWPDGIVDSGMGQWDLPETRLLDLGKKVDLKTLRLDEKAIAILLEQGYLSVTIPAKKPYPWVTQDTPTVGTANGIMCLSSMPEEDAYAITKAIFEQKSYLVSAVASFRAITVEGSLAMGKVVPLHPGAERYYREIGALK